MPLGFVLALNIALRHKPNKDEYAFDVFKLAIDAASHHGATRRSFSVILRMDQFNYTLKLRETLLSHWNSASRPFHIPFGLALPAFRDLETLAEFAGGSFCAEFR